jgi:hypothetical protein
MGYDCTLHVIDEREIRDTFIPKLLGDIDVRTAFDEKVPDADELWSRARRILEESAPEEAAIEICNLAVMFASCSHPYHYERGFSLTFWRTVWEEAGAEVADFPYEEFCGGEPERLFIGLVARYPRLKGATPVAIEHNYMTGIFLPSHKVLEAKRWIERAVKPLPALKRRVTKGLLRMLGEAADKGLAYWEATDLTLPEQAAGGSRSSVAQIEMPNGVRDVRGQGGNVLVLSAWEPSHTTFVDFSTWPPVVTDRMSEYTLQAAPVPASGAWILHTGTGGERPRQMKFHWMFLDKIGASALGGPLEFERGFLSKPLEVETDGSSEIHIVNSTAVILPSSRNGNAKSRPAIRGANGKFRLASEFPAPAMGRDVLLQPCFAKAMGSVTLKGGRGFLVWDGKGYSLAGAKPEAVFSLDGKDFIGPTTSAPLGDQGFYYLSESRLYAVGGLGETPKALLPKNTNIRQLAAGPGDWLLLHEGDNARDDAAKIYLPKEDAFIHVDHEWLGVDHVDHVAYSDPAKMFVFLTRDGKLLGVPLADVENRPRSNVKTGRAIKSR